MARAPNSNRGMNVQPSLSRTRTSPIPVVRSNRSLDIRNITSMPAGKMVPIAAFGLLREDSLRASRLRFNFEMMETVEILMNAVNVNVKAYLVPTLAFERFNGIDALNRAYEGVPDVEGGPVTPFVETAKWKIPSATVDPFYYYLGKHAAVDADVNTAYLEAYNLIWNFRAKNRSPDLELRERLDTSLAPAFWQHQAFAYIVPDFDQAIIDGEVPLNVIGGALPVKGIGFYGSDLGPFPNVDVRESGISNAHYPAAYEPGDPTVAGQTRVVFQAGSADGITAPFYPNVFAEMVENGITVSLSNIELARKTQAFAALRRQYSGMSDEFIINLLMDGISVPEQAWRQPILLGENSTIFGMAKRYSTTADDLTASVVNGATFIDMLVTSPQVPTGGVVMFVAEVTPDQLWERQKDPYLHTKSVDQFPAFLRDTLDPEKVEVVPNDYVDTDHDTPDATFGYAPLNHMYNHLGPSIGGKFYRPEVDAEFDEDRQRFWAVETQNPTLSTDFYLCTNMHTKPFVVQDQDPFEVVTRGLVGVTGNTVFGGLLVEASDDYDTIMAKAPTDRIDKSDVTAEKEATNAAQTEEE